MASKTARAILLLTTLAAAAPALAQDAGSVAVALVGPMSGPLADAGKAMAAGASLAAKHINAQGGLAGRAIALSIENDEASTIAARKIADALAAKNTRFVIGHYTSAPTVFASEVYARQNMLLIAPTATSPALPAKPGAPFLRMAPPEDAQAAFAGDALARQFPAGDIVIVHDRAVLSRTLARAAATAIAARRDAPLQRELPGPDEPDQAQALARDIAAGKPAAIYYAAGPSLAPAFLRALRAAGLNAPIMASDMLATPEFAAAAGEALDGLRMILPAKADQQPANADTVRQWRSEGVKDIALALATYASMQILAEAARRARAADPQNMAKAMRAAAPAQTVVGPVSFDASGERVERPFMIVQWRRAEDGRFVFAP